MHLEYGELQTVSSFSFLRGASHPHEYINEAFRLNYRGMALTDVNSVAGIVRAFEAARELSFTFITGCCLEITHSEGSGEKLSVLAYPTAKAAYGRLCALLTKGNLRAKKGECLLYLNDLLELNGDLITVLIPPQNSIEKIASKDKWQSFFKTAALIKESRKDKDLLYLALKRNYLPGDDKRIKNILKLSVSLEIENVVARDVRFHVPERRQLHDVLTCIKDKCSISQAGFRLLQNRESYLKPKIEIHRLYRQFPKALSNTVKIIEAASCFSLDQLTYEYPSKTCAAGKTHRQYLEELVWQGTKEKYPDGVPVKIKKLLNEELKLISELKYERYFLTCFDIVNFARKRGILCQGRGAAANSAVCFVLGITAVDPEKIDLLFARFVSKERQEPPDIDIDFEHERREEVIQYIYTKYGRERAALTAEAVTYRAKSAVRDTGKALGLSLKEVDRLARLLHRWSGYKIASADLEKAGLNPKDYRIINTLRLARQLIGFPRHLSQHTGGFILSDKPLSEIVPVLRSTMPARTIIEWNKDDIEILGILKIDILALGMLSCIRKALELANKSRAAKNQPSLKLHTIPPEDPAVYDMICEADTIGIFQIESRAQVSMLPRLKPRCFYDLVIEVAIVRPGPIKGRMVHPYLKRRSGKEKVFYPDEKVKKILGKTLGVPVFQEQAMRLAIELAGFSPGEAERLRRAMAAWKRNEKIIEKFKGRIISGMKLRGYSHSFAQACVTQIRGFSEYGFPESHAASFALLVYASAWLKKYYPAEFTAALLNSQPMGFYAPAQVINDAKRHGIEIRPVDVNFSCWESSLEKRDFEDNPAVRIGMSCVKGLHFKDGENIIKEIRLNGRADSVHELWLRLNRRREDKIKRSSLIRLARADAFSSLGLERRQALWQIRSLPADLLPLDALPQSVKEGMARLPAASKQLSLFEDYKAFGFSLKAHPLEFLREKLSVLGAYSAAKLGTRPVNSLVSAAGIVIARQKPPTAKGFCFITLEDETGLFNLVIAPGIFEVFKKTIIHSTILLAAGRLERTGKVIYINTTLLKAVNPDFQAPD